MQHNKKTYFLILIFLISFICKTFANESIFIFNPPSNWKTADPSKYLETVKVAFIDSSKFMSVIKPSINIAQEKTDIPLNEYVKIAKEEHQIESKCQQIAIIDTYFGKTVLCEIISNETFGKVKKLQAIAKKADTVYVITAACYEKDFDKYLETFLKSIHSIKAIKNIFDNFKSELDKDIFLDKYNHYLKILKNSKSSIKESKKKLKELDAYLMKNYALQGRYWQTLVLAKAIEESKL
jgi:hypothetical protein